MKHFLARLFMTVVRVAVVAGLVMSGEASAFENTSPSPFFYQNSVQVLLDETWTLLYFVGDDLYAANAEGSTLLVADTPFAALYISQLGVDEKWKTLETTPGFDLYAVLPALNKQGVAYLEIKDLQPDYNLWWIDANQEKRLLLTQRATDSHLQGGYMVPIAWSANGDLILNEVFMSEPVGRWQLSLNNALLNYIGEVDTYPTPDMTRIARWQPIGINEKHLIIEGTEGVQELPNSRDQGDVIGWVATSKLAEIKHNLQTRADTLLVDPFLYWPLPNNFRTVTCGFDCYPGHGGVDIDTNTYPNLTSVYSAAHGWVVEMRESKLDGYERVPSDNYANYVKIRHDNGYYTIYAHMQKNGVDVQLNQEVWAGTFLGKASNAGFTCGSYDDARVGCYGLPKSFYHLHFEVRTCSTSSSCAVNPYNPYIWMGNPPPVPGEPPPTITPPPNNNPPAPAPASPSDWFVARDGRAPTLCWSNSTDPDGDLVTYYAEVYQSANNANSGWTTSNCWRPSELDGRYANYQWHVKARDGRGGESAWSSTWHFSIEPQNLPPSINFQTANGDGGQTILSRDQNWTFVGTASDPEGQLNRVEWHCSGDNCGSGNSTASGTTNWSLSRTGMTGRNTVKFVAYDNAGQATESRSVDLRIDLAAPTTAVRLNNELSPAIWPTWYRGAVAVGLSAVDNGTTGAVSGMREVRYQLDGGAWQTVGGAQASFTVSADGIHTVNYYAVDNVGNVEGTRSVTFRIDATPPSPITGVSELNGAVNNQWQRTVGVPTFGWTASSDATSGLAPYQLYFGFDPNGSSFIERVNTQWTPLTGGTRTGTYYFRGRTCDVAGNCAPWATLFTFRYDITAPAAPTNITHASGIASTVWQRTTAVPNFTWPIPADEGSGTKDYYVYWGTSLTGTSTTLLATAAYQSPTPLCSGNTACTGYLRLRTRDNVDNLSGWATGFVLRYDNAPPVADFTINGGVTQTAQTSLVLNLGATDVGSGVWAMRLSGNGQEWTAWEAYTTTRQWAIPGISRQWWPVYLQVKDQVGWESAVISRTIYLDVNPQQPRSATYRLFDNAISAGAGAYSTTNYSGRGTLGQVMDSSHITSTQYGIWSGYEAGSQAIPIAVPGYDSYQFINGIFASGSGGNTLTSTAYSLHGTFGELGLPTGPGVLTGTTTITSTNYAHQPGFLAAIRVPAPVPTPDPGPTPVPEPPPACEFPRVSINQAAVFTPSPLVTLSLCAPRATEMMLSNDGGFGSAVWETYATTRTWTLAAAGAYVLPRYVYVAFKDANGNIYSTYFDDIILDPTAPNGNMNLGDAQPFNSYEWQAAQLDQATAPIFRFGGRPYARQVNGQRLAQPVPLVASTDGTVEVWLNAQDDNSGLLGELAGMQLSETGDFTDTWDIYSAQTTFTLTGTDGLKTLYARVRDGAGNTSEVFTTTFLFDTMPPIGGMALGQRFVGPSSITLTLYLGAEDNLSGLEGMRWGYAPDLADAGWQPYTFTLTLPVSLTAQTLYVQYRDFAGNVSEVYSDSYAVDNTGPVFYVEADLNPTLTRTLTLQAYDELTEVGLMLLSNDPQMLTGVVTLPYTPTLTWEFDAGKVVWVQMRDSVGNWSAPRPFFADAALAQNDWRVYLPFIRR